MYPNDRRYSKEHEWVLVTGDEARVGITQFAQAELGDIVFVELPEPGAECRNGEVLGTIESVKAVSEIFAPVSGTVVAVNAALADSPDLVNSAPHGDGWYCTIRLSDAAEVEGLLDAEAYRKLTGQ